MDTSQVSSTFTTSQVGAVKRTASHPLSPLTASEIIQARDLIHGLYSSATNFQFKTITLEEPEKAQLVPYLEAEHSGRTPPSLDRKAFVCYYIRNTVSWNVSLWHAIHAFGPGAEAAIFRINSTRPQSA